MIYHYPLQSLQEGRWFKLICGASFQHLPAVRNLSLVYSLAGADCIDVAADPAVVAAARDGIQAMQVLSNQPSGAQWPNEQWPNERLSGHGSSCDSTTLNRHGGCGPHSPLLMVSLNDGDDPHFRKAVFDPNHCPPECDRPCEKVCPAQAIVFAPSASSASTAVTSGVIRDRCYGCGRCVPICPVQHIDTESHIVSPGAIASSVLPQVDAIEIHTQVGHLESFRTLWSQIRSHVHHLKLIAVSCPDGDDFVGYLRSLHAIMTDCGQTPLPGALIWQTDGRPMSGDIGKGTTHAAIRLAQKAIAAQLPGFIQLAGGTNDHTVPTLRNLGLLSSPSLAGVAYGSYARKILSPVLDSLTADPDGSSQLESSPNLLNQAVQIAYALVSQIKQSQPSNGYTNVSSNFNTGSDVLDNPARLPHMTQHVRLHV